MDRAQRRERAWRDTHGIKDWRRAIWTALTVVVISIPALALFGSEDAVTDELILFASVLVASLLLRPFAEFGWNYLRTPSRVLWERVEKIEAQLATPRRSPSEQREAQQEDFQASVQRLRILRPIENELRTARRSAAKTLETRTGFDFEWSHSAWDAWGRALGAVTDLQQVYEKLREIYDELAELKLTYTPDFGKLEAEDVQRLEAAMPLFDSGLAVLDEAIKRQGRA